MLVEVVGTAHATRVVTASEIEGWTDIPPGRPYRVDGVSVEVPAALSIAHLLEQVSGDIGGISAGNVTWVGIPHPQRTGYVSTLDQENDHNLGPAGSNDFADGLMPAIYVNGRNDAIGYIRPSRGSGDSNGLDNFQTNSGTELRITLHTSGHILHPTITASKPRVTVGEPVTFTAQVDAADTTLSYDWSIQGAARSTDARPTVAWSAAAQSGYLVTLAVSGEDSSAGQSNTLRVVVDAAPGKPTATPKPSKDPDPSQKPGGHGDKTNPTTGPDDSEGDNAAGQPTPSADPRAEHGADGTADRPTSQPGDRRSSRPDPTEEPTPAQAGADEVAGILLGDTEAGPAEAGTPVTAPAVRAGTREPPLHIPFLVWIAVGGLAALGAGALSESGWPHRIRPTTNDRSRP